MANSTLLSLFQTTLQGMGVAAYGAPATVIGNTNQDVVQTLALVQAAGAELAREFQWQWLTTEYRFLTPFASYTGTVTEDSTRITSLTAVSGSPAAALRLPGSAGDYASTPDSSTLDITTDIEIIIYAALDDWVSPNIQELISKASGSPNNSWSFRVEQTTGYLDYAWTSSGGALTSIDSTAAPSVSNGGGLWLRVTHDVVDSTSTNNIVTFYTSNDPPGTAPRAITWTQLGDPVVTSGTTAIYASTTEVEIGARNAGASLNATGNIYAAYIYNGIGINATLAASFVPSDTTVADTSFVSALTGETWTVNGNAALTNIAPPFGSFYMSGTGIQQDTYLATYPASGSAATMSLPASSSATATTITFSQTKYTLPADFDRLVDWTQWDKTKRWEMLGPETAQQWQWLKSGLAATAPRVRFRQLGGMFQIWPGLATDDVLGFEYVSKYWVRSAAGVQKGAFSVDSDTCVFPDPLVRALIKLKYLEAKGLDTTAAYNAYTMQLGLAKAHDAGSPNLSMAPRPANRLIGWDNIPDSGYGS